jgi:hypothetical protein
MAGRGGGGRLRREGAGERAIGGSGSASEVKGENERGRRPTRAGVRVFSRPTLARSAARSEAGSGAGWNRVGRRTLGLVGAVSLARCGLEGGLTCPSLSLLCVCSDDPREMLERGREEVKARARRFSGGRPAGGRRDKTFIDAFWFGSPLVMHRTGRHASDVSADDDDATRRSRRRRPARSLPPFFPHRPSLPVAG